jgi:hypothetical protein
LAPTEERRSPVSVQLPGKLVNDQAEDLAAPLKQLLQELGLLETDADVTKGAGVRGTPDSLHSVSRRDLR